MEKTRQDLYLNAELSPAQTRDVQRRIAAGELRRMARGMATPLPPAARLPRISEPCGMRASAKGTGLPPITIPVLIPPPPPPPEGQPPPP